MGNIGFQIILVKSVDSERGTEHYEPYVLVNGVAVGLVRKIELEFDSVLNLPILKMEKVMYGSDSVQTMTESEFEKWKAARAGKE